MKDDNTERTTLDALAHHLSVNSPKRQLVSIAGPPGVGKSTAANYLANKLNVSTTDNCAVLAMDGFHFDDIYLNKMKWRPRKGAPHTFDVDGLAHMLKRLRDNNEHQVAVPVFDRKIEIARAGAQMIKQQTKIILVEGNYLLLKDQPWQSLHRLFDISIMLTCPINVILQRLRNRWIDFDYTDAQITEKMNGNDIPNVETVISKSVKADFEITTHDQV